MPITTRPGQFAAIRDLSLRPDRPQFSSKPFNTLNTCNTRDRPCYCTRPLRSRVTILKSDPLLI